MSNKSFTTSLLILLFALSAVAVIFFRPVPVVVHTNLERLPMEIAGHIGQEDSFPETVYRELNADMNLYRHYRSGDGSQLDLYIGYYGTAKGGRTGHNPYVCLPSTGWAIVDARKMKIRDPYQSNDVEANFVQARNNGVNTVMIHWYQTAGTKLVSSGLQQNLERFEGRILRNRNDGAFVRISTEVSDDQVIDATKKVRDFAGQMLHLLPGYWPTEEG